MMKRRYVLSCVMVLCGLLGLLFIKGDSSYTELTFSKESGFYEEAFELELYAPIGTEIYYTLDGSEPDENAIRYREPIPIGDATDNDNVYSLRKDVSAGLLTEEIAEYGEQDPGYVVPDYNIDKCTVVRAVCLDADGNYSEIKTKSYFVGYRDKRGYDGMNIISIVTAPDNFFDYDTGIYVLGKAFGQYVDNSELGKDSRWWCWYANYRQHGLETERPVNIQLFNTERELLLEQECGIRIQGGGSRGRLPRSMNIYAREQYSENGRFYVDLFDTGYMPDTVTLFAGGNDSWTKFRDSLTAGLIKDRNFSTLHFEPYAMFLDGEYWGVYWLTEKYNDVFLSYYYDVEKDNVVMIKCGMKSDILAEGGAEEDENLYTEMMDFMTSTDFFVDGDYEYACQLVDMQSLIDYFVTEIYIGNIDWRYDNNCALWRTREIKDGKYEDGRWRWMLFDVNLALSADVTDMDTLSDTMDTNEMFCNLCNNEDFKRQFVITFMDIINTCFTEERVDSAFSDYSDLMSEPMSIHLKRFFGTEDNSKFSDAVEDIKYFLDNRKPYIVQYLKEDLGLDGTLAPVEVEINNPDAGSIIVNTAELSFDEKTKWRGEYFTDYPITLTAAADEGYRFVRWENDIVSDEESIVVDIGEEGISVRAVFEKIH